MKFTVQEEEIIRMLILGHKAPAIQQWVGLSHKEFINIKRRIFRHLGVSRAIQLLNVVMKTNFISI